MKKIFTTAIAFTLASIVFQSCKHEVVVAPCNSATVGYAADIQPILSASCTSCHSSTATVRNAGIYLENWANVSDVISSNDSAYFVSSIAQDAGVSPMPKGGSKLSDCDIAKIKTWIAAGYPNN